MQSSRQRRGKWGPSEARDSHRLRGVRGRHTRPELAVRQLVHSLGYRYRLHHSGLPGQPDLVFPRRRKVILVHGCFWHRHACSRGRSTPLANKNLWLLKFEATRKRDRRVISELRALGWDVLVIWECQIGMNKGSFLVERVRGFLERSQPQREEESSAKDRS